MEEVALACWGGGRCGGGSPGLLGGGGVEEVALACWGGGGGGEVWGR